MRRARRALQRPSRQLAGAAASLLVASSAGCNARQPAAESAAPAQPTASVEVLVPPVMSASTAVEEPSTPDPADTGPSARASAPTPPASALNPVAPAPTDLGPGGLPRCCMMHILVPGCQCGGPPLPPAPKKP